MMAQSSRDCLLGTARGETSGAGYETLGPFTPECVGAPEGGASSQLRNVRISSFKLFKIGGQGRS